MKYAAMPGWAIVIYSVMFLLWSGLVIYDLADASWAWFVQMSTLAIVTTIAARSLRLYTIPDMLLYSVSWAILAAVLDAVFSIPFSGWQIYYEWRVWFGYALVVTIPLLSVKWFKMPPTAEGA